MNKKVLMVIWNIAIVVFLSLLALVPINAAPEGIAFSFHPKEGQVFNQVVDIDFQISLPGNAALAKMKLAMGLGYSIQVLKVDDNNDVTTKMTIKTVKIEMPGFLGQSGSYDSSDPFALPSGTTLAYALLEGCEMDMKLNSASQVLETKVAESYLNRVIEHLAPDNDGKKAELQEKLRKSQADIVIKSQNNYTEGIFTGKPIYIGETIKQTIEENRNGFIMPQQVSYTLHDVRNGVAYFTLQSKILSCRNEISGSPIQFTRLEGGVKGTIEVLVDSGIPNRVNLVLKINGNLGSGKQKFGMQGRVELKPFESGR